MPKPHGSPCRYLVELMKIFVFNRDRRWAPGELIHHLGLGTCKEIFFFSGKTFALQHPCTERGHGQPQDQCWILKIQLAAQSLGLLEPLRASCDPLSWFSGRVQVPQDCWRLGVEL